MDRMDRFDASKTRRLELLLDACAKRHQQSEDECLIEQAKNSMLHREIEQMEWLSFLMFISIVAEAIVIAVFWFCCRRGS